ncbi:MAG: molybdopterin-dependent oxidoreductase [Actinomycetes bacterium]
MSHEAPPEPTPGATDSAPTVVGQPGSPVGRRVVLGMLGLAALGVAAGAPISRGFERVLGPLQNNDPTGLSGLIPGAGGWRYYSVTASEPAVSSDSFSLAVSGLVDHPLELSFADLAGLPQTTVTHDFQCVTGWRVQDVTWRGVQVRDLLSLAGLAPTATSLRFTSSDGAYTESLTLDQVRTDDVLVATSMDDAPVTRAHGGPVRLYVAPMYGYKSLKWLKSIDVTDSVQPGYWEQRGYDVDAYVGRSNGRSDPATA